MDGFIINAISNCIACCLFVWIIGIFLKGFLGLKDYEPISIKGMSSIDDQDMYAVASGDEDFLAAHCTLYDTETFKQPETTKSEIEAEKLDIQKLKNSIAMMKLKRELEELKRTEQPTQAGQTHSNQLNELIGDCEAALVALGYKNTDAKKLTKNFFIQNPNTKSIDEFLDGVFSK